MKTMSSLELYAALTELGFNVKENYEYNSVTVPDVAVVKDTQRGFQVRYLWNGEIRYTKSISGLCESLQVGGGWQGH